VNTAAEPQVSLWVLASLDILVREAGGTFTDLEVTDSLRTGNSWVRVPVSRSGSRAPL
jgi:histidinol-phosphatase